jgi:hypothetical protein
MVNQQGAGLPDSAFASLALAFSASPKQGIDLLAKLKAVDGDALGPDGAERQTCDRIGINHDKAQAVREVAVRGDLQGDRSVPPGAGEGFR